MSISRRAPAAAGQESAKRRSSYHDPMVHYQAPPCVQVNTEEEDRGARGGSHVSADEHGGQHPEITAVQSCVTNFVTLDALGRPMPVNKQFANNQ